MTSLLRRYLHDLGAALRASADLSAELSYALRADTDEHFRHNISTLAKKARKLADAFEEMHTATHGDTKPPAKKSAKPPALKLFCWGCAMTDTGQLLVLAHDLEEAEALARASSLYKYRPNDVDKALASEPDISYGPQIVTE